MGQIGYSSGFAQQTSFGPSHNWEFFLPSPDGGFVGFYRDDDGWHGPYGCTPPGSARILTPYHEIMYVYLPRADWGIEDIETALGNEGPPEWTAMGLFTSNTGPEGRWSGLGWALGTMWSGDVNWEDSAELGFPILVGTNRSGQLWTVDKYIDAIGQRHEFDQLVTTGVRGRPAVVQSDRGYDSGWLGRGVSGNRHQGNYELVAPSATGGFVHAWRPNGDGEEAGVDPWRPAGTYGALLYDELSVFQLKGDAPGEDDTAPLELFAWVRGESWVHHFEQRNPTPGQFVWSGPFKVGPKPVSAGVQPGIAIGTVRPAALTALMVGADGSVQAINSSGDGWTVLDEILPAGTSKPGTPIAVSGWLYTQPAVHADSDAIAALAGHDGSVLALRMPATGEWGKFQQVLAPGTVLPGTPVALSQSPGSEQQVIAYAAVDGSVQAVTLPSKLADWGAPVTLAPAGAVAPGAAVQMIARYLDAPLPTTGEGPPPPPDGSADRLDLVYVGTDGAVYDVISSWTFGPGWRTPAQILPPGSVPAGGAICLTHQASRDRPYDARILLTFAAADGSIQAYDNEVGSTAFTGPVTAAPAGSSPVGALLAGSTRAFNDNPSVLWAGADGTVQVITRLSTDTWTRPTAVTPPGTALPGGHVNVQDATPADVLFVAPDWSLKHFRLGYGTPTQAPEVIAAPFPATPEHTAAVMTHIQTLLADRVGGEAAIRAFEGDGVSRQLVATDASHTADRGSWLLFPIQTGMAAGGRQADAVAACQEAYAVFTELIQQNPANTDYRYNQVRALVTLTERYSEQGTPAVAADTAEQAITAARTLATATPAYQQSTAEWLVWPLQAVLAAAGRLPEAISACREAINIAAGLLNADPTNNTYAYDHASALVSLVERYLDHADPQLAVDTAAQAADAARAMGKADPTQQQSFGEWLLWPIQAAYNAANQLPQAISACQEAVGVFAQLTGQDAANLSYRYDYARALVTLAERYLEHGDHTQASDTAAQALDVGHALTAADTTYQPSLAEWLVETIALALDSAGHHDQAIAGATEAVQIFQLLNEGDPAQYGTELAGAQALLAKLKTEPNT